MHRRMRRSRSGFGLSFAAVLLGSALASACAVPLENGPRARDAVTEGATALASAPVELRPITLPVGAKSYVVFARRAHLAIKGHDSVLGDHVLSFSRWSARIEAEEPPKIVVDIDLTSLWSDEGLVASMARNQLLEVDRYQHASLVGTLARTSIDGQLVIDGTVDLHGKQGPLRFVGTMRPEGDGYRLDASFDMSRHAFGLSYAPIEPFLDDNFRIVVSAVARPERVEVQEED